MLNLQARLGEILSDASVWPGVLGIALISRDGLPVKATGKLELNRETFSAMSATLMGAAEIALAEVDGSRARHVVVTTDLSFMVLLGAGRDLILVTHLRSDAPLQETLHRLQEIARSVATIVPGG